MNGQFRFDEHGNVDVVPTALTERPDERQGEMLSPMAEFFGPPISVYTREQAIDDGVLVDVSVHRRWVSAVS